MNEPRISTNEPKRDPQNNPTGGATLSEDPRFKMFNLTELAIKMGVPRKYVTVLKKDGAPFAHGRTRPKWVKKWTKGHIHDEFMKKPVDPEPPDDDRKSAA